MNQRVDGMKEIEVVKKKKKKKMTLTMEMILKQMLKEED